MLPRNEALFRKWMEVINNKELSNIPHLTLRRSYSVCGEDFHTPQFQTPERKKVLVIMIPICEITEVSVPARLDEDVQPSTLTDPEQIGSLVTKEFTSSASVDIQELPCPIITEPTPSTSASCKTG